jgi:biotin transporter BioY
MHRFTFERFIGYPVFSIDIYFVCYFTGNVWLMCRVRIDNYFRFTNSLLVFVLIHCHPKFIACSLTKRLTPNLDEPFN